MRDKTHSGLVGCDQTTKECVPTMLSDIEIADAATPQPIIDLAREKLGIEAEALSPYGHTKAKVSLPYIR